MKQRQLQEIALLDRIIEESSLKHWDGINDGARGLFGKDKIRYREDGMDINPEVLYFKINGGGAKGIICCNKEKVIRVNKLLKAKQKYDLMMKMWIEDIKEGLLYFSELREDGWDKEAQIIWNKLKKEGPQYHHITKM